MDTLEALRRLLIELRGTACELIDAVDDGLRSPEPPLTVVQSARLLVRVDRLAVELEELADYFAAGVDPAALVPEEPLGSLAREAIAG